MNSYTRHFRRAAFAMAVALTLGGGLQRATEPTIGAASALAADVGDATATPSTCTRLGPVTGWTGHITFRYDYTKTKTSDSSGTTTQTFHRQASYAATLGTMQQTPPNFVYMAKDTSVKGTINADDRTVYASPGVSSWERRQTVAATTYATFGPSMLEIDTTNCTYGFSSGIEAQNILYTDSSGGNRPDDDLLVGYVTLPPSEKPIGKSLELSGHEAIPASIFGARGFSFGYVPDEHPGTATVSWSFEPIGVCPGELSGPDWATRFPDSKSTTALNPPFRDHVDSFLSSLKAAHATVSIGTTYRPKERGYLMRYSYDISNHLIDPAKVPAYPGVHVCWVHENLASSLAAATQLMHAYHIVYRPAWPNSRHFVHLAIDMTIGWTGTLAIKDASDKIVKITSTPRTGAGNSDLWDVGQTYGVIKLKADPPHWSSDGH